MANALAPLKHTCTRSHVHLHASAPLNAAVTTAVTAAAPVMQAMLAVARTVMLAMHPNINRGAASPRAQAVLHAAMENTAPAVVDSPLAPALNVRRTVVLANTAPAVAVHRLAPAQAVLHAAVANTALAVAVHRLAPA